MVALVKQRKAREFNVVLVSERPRSGSFFTVSLFSKMSTCVKYLRTAFSHGQKISPNGKKVRARKYRIHAGGYSHNSNSGKIPSFSLTGWR